MTQSILQSHVLTYFRGVDSQDLALTLSTLSSDCVFSVETHGVELHGHDEISGMFERLWASHKSVRHDKFHFIEDQPHNLVAVRFRVTNKLHNDELVYKSNCNFFSLTDGVFTDVKVYMAGENTLDHNAEYFVSDRVFWQ